MKPQFDTTLPYAATLGLVVLQSDETLEQDLRRLLPGGQVATYVTRIPSATDLTADSIAQMGRDLPAATSLFPRPTQFDAVAYGCTSGTTLLGADKVDATLRAHCSTHATTNPLSAALAAMRQLGVQRIGLVTPYALDIAADVQAAFEDAGHPVPHAVAFGERNEANVVRISAASLAEAAHEVARDVDAVFLSCTNLRTLDLITPLEAALGIPVLSSNLCLIWHLAALSDAADHMRGPGRLLNG